MYGRVTQGQPRAVVNKFTLRDTDFNLTMLCLFEGGIVSKDIPYDSQL